MNVELLTRVMNKLKRMRHKKHFDMGYFVSETDCGTAACIAGWALVESGYKPVDPSSSNDFISPTGHRVKAARAARQVLGLGEAKAGRLFHANNWPEKFNRAGGSWWIDEDVYNNPKVAAARIKHFIETKGKE